MVGSIIKLREVLRQHSDRINVEDSKEYKQITVSNTGEIKLRGIKKGLLIGTKKQIIAKKGQFIYSRLGVHEGSLGIVPEELDGAIVTGDMPLFDINNNKILSDFLLYSFTLPYFKEKFSDLTRGLAQSRIREKFILDLEIEVPSLEEQKKIVSKIKLIKEKIGILNNNYNEQNTFFKNLLHNMYIQIIKNVDYKKMKLVAPIIRRPVIVEKNTDYLELGIRSFGKGTFHKPAVKGHEIGTKRIYFLEESDLLFSNVFAWEGAIAVVKKEDKGRVGSHRFISCKVNPDYALPSFLLYHFLTKEGIRRIREASPGGAGRNRTLGLKKLEEIEIPLPSLDKQKKFVMLKEKFEQLKKQIIEDKIEIEKLGSVVIKEGFKK